MSGGFWRDWMDRVRRKFREKFWKELGGTFRSVVQQSESAKKEGAPLPKGRVKGKIINYLVENKGLSGKEASEFVEEMYQIREEILEDQLRERIELTDEGE